MRLIDADYFANRMYHEAFEKDTDMQRWDSGCWIRYKLFENVLREQPTAQPEQRWIPCSERLPEEDHWLGGSGKQFSDNVLISITNHEDEDAWSDISQTIDGKWALELPRHCEITAWRPLPEPYRGGDKE